MSRVESLGRCQYLSFPRLRGDEPGVGRDEPQLIQFSPPTRG